MQPSWVFDQGVIASLANAISGWDWVFFCSGCKELRRYLGFHRDLSVQVDNISLDRVREPKEETKSLIFPETVRRISVTCYVGRSLYYWKFPKRLEHLSLPVNTYVNLDKLGSLRYLTTLSAGYAALTTPRKFRRLRKLKVNLSASYPFRFPSSLTDLEVQNVKQECLNRIEFPASLVRLKMTNAYPCKLVQLPNGLKEFEIHSVYFWPLEDIQFPKSLEVLKLDGLFPALPTTGLPVGLKFLHLTMSYRRINDFPHTLPAGLNGLFLQFTSSVTTDTLGVLKLPESLEFLALAGNFNQNPNGFPFPSGLKTLEFGDSFNQSVDHLPIPKELKKLKFGYHFNQPLDKLVLPHGLTELDLSGKFQYVDHLTHLPETLQLLKLSRTFLGKSLPVAIPSRCIVKFV